MTNAECIANLAEARAKYHDLMLGGMPRVVVDQNGQRVEFTAANSAALNLYILRLEGICGCSGGTPVPTSGPATFLF